MAKFLKGDFWALKDKKNNHSKSEVSVIRIQ